MAVLNHLKLLVVFHYVNWFFFLVLVEKKGEEGNNKLSTKCLCLDFLFEKISFEESNA